LTSLVNTRGLDTHLARALLQSESVEYSLLHDALTRVRVERQTQPRTLALELLELGLIEEESLERTLARLVGEAPALGWQIGSVVAGLEISGHLGIGGMGQVYLARDTQTGSEVAVKTLVVGGDEELLARFAREAEAQARVDSHQNVVRIHRSGFAAGRAFLVMDAVPGGDLSQRLGAGPLSPAAAASLVRDLALGLAHAHARGVLHRDLKPSNILFDELGAPRLADFGLARLIEAQGLTQTGQILGTPGYMAPEQACGEAQDERTDVYGLGGVLFAALTCSAPFTGGSVYATLDQVLTGQVPDPRTTVPGTPAALAEICQRSLAKSPEDRYASAQALADALGEFLTGESNSLGVSSGALGATVGLLALALVLGLLAWAWAEGEGRQALHAESSAVPLPSVPLTESEVRKQVKSAELGYAQAELARHFLKEGLGPTPWLEARAGRRFFKIKLSALAGVKVLPGGRLLIWTDTKIPSRAWGVQVRGGERGEVLHEDMDPLVGISPKGERLALVRGTLVRIVSAHDLSPVDEFEVGRKTELSFLSKDTLLLYTGRELALREVGSSAVTKWVRSERWPVTAVDPAPGGQLIYLALGREGPHHLSCYSKEGLRHWFAQKFDSRARVLALSPDGRLAALGTALGGIHLFKAGPLPQGSRESLRNLVVDAATKDVLFQGRAHNGGVRSLVWLANGRLLSVGGEKGKVHLWSAAGDCLAADLVEGKNVAHVAFNEDESRIYFVSEGALYGAFSAPNLPSLHAPDK